MPATALWPTASVALSSVVPWHVPACLPAVLLMWAFTVAHPLRGTWTHLHPLGLIEQDSCGARDDSFAFAVTITDCLSHELPFAPGGPLDRQLEAVLRTPAELHELQDFCAAHDVRMLPCCLPVPVMPLLHACMARLTQRAADAAGNLSADVSSSSAASFVSQALMG